MAASLLKQPALRKPSACYQALLLAASRMMLPIRQLSLADSRMRHLQATRAKCGIMASHGFWLASAASR
jgi:hypothetical protein